MLKRYLIAAGLALLSATIPQEALQGQDLRYDMVTKLEFGGRAGRILGAMPGGGGPTVETTFVKGNRIRRDEDPSSSSVMDWEKGVLTILDHNGRTYVQMALEEMAVAAQEAAEALQGELAEMKEAAAEGAETAAQEAEQEYRDEGGDQLGLEVAVLSDRTGQTRSFGEFMAEQVLITLEIKGEKDAADWDSGDTQGGLALVTELWLSTDFPEYRVMMEGREEMAERTDLDRTNEGLLGQMEALLEYDPRIKFAFEKNRETIDALDGVALKTTTHFVNLPEEVRLDVQQVLADQDRSLGDDVSDAAQEGVRNAAKSAVKGGTGRLFGRRDEPEPEPEPEVPEPKQSVFLRMISEIDKVSTDPLDESLFQVPAGYTETGGGE